MTVTAPPPGGNMAAFQDAAAASADPDMFRAYFLGTLAGELSDQRELWAHAIEVAQGCEKAAAARAACSAERGKPRGH